MSTPNHDDCELASNMIMWIAHKASSSNNNNNMLSVADVPSVAAAGFEDPSNQENLQTKHELQQLQQEHYVNFQP